MIRFFRAWAAGFAARFKVWRRPVSDAELDRALSGLGRAVTAIVDAHPHAAPEYRDRFIDWLRARDAMRAAEQPQGSRPVAAHGHTPDQASRATRLEVVATRWDQAIASESYIPQDRSRELAEFLRELSLHVISPDLARTTADRIGYELALRFQTTSGAFARTVELLSEFFRALREQQPRMSDWTPVLALFSQGYAEGTRARALEGQDWVIEAALRAALVNTQSRNRMDTAPMAMGVVDPDGFVTVANQALRQMVGGDNILGRSLSSVADQGDGPRVRRLLHPSTCYDQVGSAKEFRLAQPSHAAPVWVKVHWGRHSGGEGVPEEFPFLLEDVTQQRVLRSWLSRSGQYGGVFELPGRRQFIDRLTALLSTPGTGRVGMFAVRLDGLDAVAAQHGSLVADRVAQAFVARARAAADQAEMITQLEESTIAILVAGSAQWAAVGTAMQVLVQGLAMPVTVAGDEAVPVVPIIGAVTDGGHHGDADALIRWLDHCLDVNRRATSLSRPQAAHPTGPVLDYQLVVDVAGLGQAVAAGGVQLAHTPIGSARSGRVIGSHARFEWTYPPLWTGGTEEVLDLADTFHLAAAATHWMVGEAAALIARWHRLFPDRTPFVRVDLPGRQPLTDALVTHIEALLNQHRFPAHLLELAVPETSLFDDDGRFRREIVSVTGKGVRLVLTGLGEDVRRLRLLRRVALSGVVLDPHLASDLSPTPQQGNKTVIEMLIEFAKGLPLETTVPGVSTREQREKLKKLGAVYIEGDLVGQPGTAAKLEELVRKSTEIRAVATP